MKLEVFVGQFRLSAGTGIMFSYTAGQKFSLLLLLCIRLRSDQESNRFDQQNGLITYNVMHLLFVGAIVKSNVSTLFKKKSYYI